MRKRLLTAIAVGCMTVAMSMTSFAAEWKQDNVGWWYQNDDGSYLKDCWSWIGGRCYYFDSNGYCLLNTTTPDGYTVDASGAWTVNGVVQEQSAPAAATTTQSQTAEVETTGEETHVAGLTFETPAGFYCDDALSDENAAYYFNEEAEVAIVVMSEPVPEVEELGSYSEAILDLSMDFVGTVQEKSAHQYAGGTWYRYRFADEDADAMGIPGHLYIYSRIHGANVQMVMIAGTTENVDMSGIMKNCLK